MANRVVENLLPVTVPIDGVNWLFTDLRIGVYTRGSINSSAKERRVTLLIRYTADD
jgi:hypothetical protein